MSAAARAVAKLYALQKAGAIPKGVNTGSGIKVLTGLTQGGPMGGPVGPMPVEVVKELKKLEKIISSAQKGKGGKATQDLKNIIRSLESKGAVEGNALFDVIKNIIQKDIVDIDSMTKKEYREYLKEVLKGFNPSREFGFLKGITQKGRSVPGEGRTPLKIEDLSKKEIQEAIKKRFPLTPPPPKGGVADFGDIPRGKKSGRQPLSQATMISPEFLTVYRGVETGKITRVKPALQPATEKAVKKQEAAKGLSRTEDYEPQPTAKLGGSKPQEASEEAMDYFKTQDGQAEVPTLDFMARTLHFSDKEVFDQLMSEFKLKPAQEQFIFSRLLDLSGNARLRKETFDKLEGINAASAREARRFSDARTVKERKKKDDQFVFEDVDDAVGTDKPLQDDFAEVGDFFSDASEINLPDKTMQGLVAAGREGMGTFDSSVRAQVISSIMREIPPELRGNLFNTLMSPVETRQTQFLRSLLGKADEQGTLAFTLNAEDLQKLPKQLKGFVKPSKGGTMLDVPVADLGARKLLLRDIPTIKRSLNLTQEFNPRNARSLKLVASSAQEGNLIIPGNELLPRAEDLMSGERLVEFQRHLGMLGKMGN